MSLDAATTLAKGGSLNDAGLTGYQGAGAGLQVASTLFSSIYAGRQAAKNASAANAAIAQDAAAQQYQLSVQRQQMSAQAGQQQSEVARQAQKERARLDAMSGEAGVAGGVLDRLGTQEDFVQSDTNAAIDQNLQGATNQSYMQGLSVQARAQSQINANTAAAKAARPNWMGLGLQLAGIGVGLDRTAAENSILTHQFSRRTQINPIVGG